MKEYNPFNPNSIVTTSLFAGRTTYILNILGKLQQIQKGMSSSFFLYGERGIGKTALAKLIKHIAETKDQELANLNFLTSYYSVGKGQASRDVLQSSLNDLTNKMPTSMIDSLGKTLGKVFQNGKFSLGGLSVQLAGQQDKCDNISLKDSAVSVISNILTEIKKDQEGREVKDGILMIFDEFDNIDDLSSCAQLFRGITTTLNINKLGFIAFLIIGYEQTVERFFKEDTSARRDFDLVKLGVMPYNEAGEVLTKGFSVAQVTWDQKALGKNIISTGGYPHSIQIMGHNLIEVDNDKNVTQQDWQKAISQTASELRHKDFASMYDFKGKPRMQELILFAMAIEGQALSQPEIKKYCKNKNIYQCIPELVKKGSIKRLSGEDKFILHSSLFRTAIMNHTWPLIKNLPDFEDVLRAYFKKAIDLKKKKEGKSDTILENKTQTPSEKFIEKQENPGDTKGVPKPQT